LNNFDPDYPRALSRFRNSYLQNDILDDNVFVLLLIENWI